MDTLSRKKSMLAAVLNSDLAIKFTSWQPGGAGTASEPISPSDILVKYTYTGDFRLSGSVISADYTIFSRYYGKAVTDWADADMNWDGTVSSRDYTLFNKVYNDGTASATLSDNVPVL